MDYRKTKRNFYHIVIAVESGVNPAVKKLEEQPLDDNYLFDGFHRDANMFVTTTDFLLGTYGTFGLVKPLFINILLWVADEDRATFQSREGINIIADLTSKFECKTACQLQTVYCPFSTYTQLRSHSRTTYTRGEIFTNMQARLGATHPQSFPKGTAVVRNKVVYELRKDFNEEDEMCKRVKRIVESKRGVVLERTLDIFELGAGALSVFVDNRQMSFDMRPIANSSCTNCSLFNNAQ